MSLKKHHCKNPFQEILLQHVVPGLHHVLNVRDTKYYFPNYLHESFTLHQLKQEMECLKKKSPHSDFP